MQLELFNTMQVELFKAKYTFFFYENIEAEICEILRIL